ncbi:Origin recognition complex subunit 2 [Stygiomarasmius scandens]|uniref:Origin recognition complex subunit 2 n=1 Tax=Marasmiellus scandens TaxID=2682957 RepID=A0ABR1J537_9AGAR
MASTARSHVPQTRLDMHNDHDESSSSSSSDAESQASSQYSDAGEKKTSPRKNGQTESSRIIVQSSFDAYFIHASSRAQTSNSVFSNLIPPLSQEEYADASKSFPPPLQSDILSDSSQTKLFQRFMHELNEGWNVLCYGFGSKRTLLNQFAFYVAKSKSKLGKGHVVVVNGFQPDFAFKDLLYAIEQNLPGLAEFQASSTSGSTPADTQIHRIKEFLRYTSEPEQQQPKTKTRKKTSDSDAKPKPKHRDLYIIIHNIDSPSLRTQKVQSSLSSLALDPHIHVVASIDHINAPLIWSSSEAAARKEGSSSSTISPQGFAWLYHDCTTLLPYDVELAHIDPSSIKLRSTAATATLGHGTGGGDGSAAAAIVAAGGISETAALHVLASVTQKAKKLFLLMAKRQLESIESAASGGDANASDLSAHSIPYSTVFSVARDEFIATTTTSLRSLLGEFRDHGLVVGKGGDKGGGSSEEVLWIPMRKERLAKVAKEVEKSI